MNIDSLVRSLHRLERKVLPLLPKHTTVAELVKASTLQETEVIRALQWLQNKRLVELKKEVTEVVKLGSNGAEYIKQGLPERRFLEALRDGKALTLKQVMGKASLDSQEVNVSLGLLRKKQLITLKKEKVLMVVITEQGLKALRSTFLEEQFLKLDFPVDVASLSAEHKHALENLLKRKDIVKKEVMKSFSAMLTDLGKKAIKAGLREDYIDAVTPELLQSKQWKGKSFRYFDVEINVPAIFSGRKQHYRAFLDEVRQKFMSLGFKEMTGPVVETEFWNMDALYMPQFHAARAIHDAYYVKEPRYGKLDEKLVKKVQQAHEKGVEGSKGWQYAFDTKRTHRHLLRTQGTACSSRMLASKELEIPGKYFGITRCFRKDVIDATHLPDFNQVEGIIVEEGLTLRHLFGLLKLFAKEFAQTDEIRVVPGYFPFTEPSCELFAKHPEMGWIELGGAGIFRPEMVKPLLGKNISVLAWGLGVDRLGMFRLGIKDIRDLFEKDIDKLRTMRVI